MSATRIHLCETYEIPADEVIRLISGDRPVGNWQIADAGITGKGSLEIVIVRGEGDNGG